MSAHEITHHFVTDISHSTIFAMKRKERQDVPMWLEEGLGMLIMSEVSPALHAKFAGSIAGITEWCDSEAMWHDLSHCRDVDKAYIQAYKEAGALVDAVGRPEVIRLLYLNRTHCMNRNGLSREGRASAKAGYANDGRP